MGRKGKEREFNVHAAVFPKKPGVFREKVDSGGAWCPGWKGEPDNSRTTQASCLLRM